MAKKQAYGNESITTLKGAERVRKRPAVIFGSDGLDGCEHAVFEILSNAIDEAREGYGKLIIVTRYADRSIEVEDFGRGCPVDWNEKEQRYNWELVFCDVYNKTAKMYLPSCCKHRSGASDAQGRRNSRRGSRRSLCPAPHGSVASRRT